MLSSELKLHSLNCNGHISILVQIVVLFGNKKKILNASCVLELFAYISNYYAVRLD